MIIKRLRSVVHSIAHHSVSGLCYAHPHLGEACKRSGSDRAQLDLLTGNPKTEFEENSKEISGAADGLREKFSTILQSENLLAEDIFEASALFVFQRNTWPAACYVRVVTISGRAVDVAVDEIGNPAEILKTNNLAKQI